MPLAEPPRVLALSHVFPRTADDPSAPFLLTWAQALQAAGATVTVVAPHDAGMPLRHTVGGVPVVLARYSSDEHERVAYRGEMHQLARDLGGVLLIVALIAALARTVRRELRSGAVDVVHVHWWVPGLLAMRLVRCKVPVVVTVHGTDVALVEGHPRLAALARWLLKRVDRIEAVSTDLAERLERATGLTTDAINPMPLAAQWFAGAGAGAGPAGTAGTVGGPAGPARIVAVGRMVPEKGFADLIEAAALLDQPVVVEIIGDGPEYERLRALAEARGVELQLPGRVAPELMRAVYARAAVVAQPSHREGLGLVAAEALLCGTPVVAADSGGVRDILPASLLVPAGDPAALAARLREVLRDLPAARAQAATFSTGLAGRLSPAASAARTLAAYTRL